jgi:hypothetical protein
MTSTKPHSQVPRSNINTLRALHVLDSAMYNVGCCIGCWPLAIQRFLQFWTILDLALCLLTRTLQHCYHVLWGEGASCTCIVYLPFDADGIPSPVERKVQVIGRPSCSVRLCLAFEALCPCNLQVDMVTLKPTSQTTSVVSPSVDQTPCLWLGGTHRTAFVRGLGGLEYRL